MGNIECLSPLNNNWNYLTIQKTFEKADINYLPSCPLSREELNSCSVGKLLSKDQEIIYKTEIFVNNDLSFFARGDFPAELINSVLQKRIGEVTYSSESGSEKKILGIEISSQEKLKRFVKITKNYYQATSIPTGQ